MENIGEEQLAKYPAVQWYLTHIRGFSKKERLAWGDGENIQPDASCGLARRLDLDLTY